MRASIAGKCRTATMLRFWRRPSFGWAAAAPHTESMRGWDSGDDASCALAIVYPALYKVREAANEDPGKTDDESKRILNGEGGLS